MRTIERAREKEKVNQTSFVKNRQKRKTGKLFTATIRTKNSAREKMKHKTFLGCAREFYAEAQELTI